MFVCLSVFRPGASPLSLATGARTGVDSIAPTMVTLSSLATGKCCCGKAPYRVVKSSTPSRLIQGGPSLEASRGKVIFGRGLLSGLNLAASPLFLLTISGNYRRAFVASLPWTGHQLSVYLSK